MTPWLSDAELIELTGYKRPADQLRWLNTNHVKAYLNGANRVRVPRDAFQPAQKAGKARTEPDFTKVRRAS